MDTIRTKGIVIRKFHYSETSTIVTLFTEKKGKIKFAAKGARRKKSQFKGNLDLFNHIDIAYYDSLKKKQDLHTLIDCQLINPYLSIRKDVIKFAIASYFADLISNLASLEDPEERIYILLDTVLNELNKKHDEQLIMRNFEIKLLTYTGFLSEFFRCIRCSKKIVNSGFKGNIRGKIYCSNCASPEHMQVDKGALMAFSYIFKQDIAKPLRLKLSKIQLKQLDGLLKDLIETACERKLKTRKILDDLLMHQV